ncbi:protein LYK2 [Carica papaya]|uniref:protein LYK2 n=1 Tax=Carica papaya TaxID=3649 RepID=UPI000B8CAE99|nr:protein LYK2 [Carica papaya]
MGLWFQVLSCLLAVMSKIQTQKSDCSPYQDLLSCQTSSTDAYGYHCSSAEDQCATYIVLHVNSYFSSLTNLTSYLGLNPFVIADTNGLSPDTEFLPLDQPLLIPILCKCSVSTGFYQATANKTAVKGESFYSIAGSLEGLTTCKAIQEQNPGVSPWNLEEKAKLLVPLRCACSKSKLSKFKLLLSYPIREGDTVSGLAIKFNTTEEAILSANNESLRLIFKPDQTLLPFSSILIPVKGKPVIGPALLKPREPNLRFPATDIPIIKRKPKMWKVGVYIAVTGVIVGAAIAIAVVFLFLHLKKIKNKKNKKKKKKNSDVELQQLSLSVRTTSDKKVSFEGSGQDPIDRQSFDTTPRKVLIETYTIDELRKATEDFSSSNLIEGSVYHGRLNGKNMAIKRTSPEIAGKVDISLVCDPAHHHPNIIKLMGTCFTDGPDAFLVFEYAKNGSLKDWLHGGLAMKNQFISSCYCFLTWNQRLRICLDIALALQYMHQIMNPSYVHQNIKARNIFLDEDFNAKIANFGMSRCIEDETEHPDFSSTSPATWSLGYLSPEYVQQGIISPKMDIFAFGVVLVEVLSGQTPVSRPENKQESGGSVWLSEKIKSVLVSENPDEELREFVDKALGENYSVDSVFVLANLARSCVEDDPGLRPNAVQIVDKLSRLVEEAQDGSEEHFLICESSCKPLVKQY